MKKKMRNEAICKSHFNRNAPTVAGHQNPPAIRHGSSTGINRFWTRVRTIE